MLTLRIPKEHQGTWLIVSAWWGIVPFAVVAICASIWTEALGLPIALLSLVLFAIGCLAFSWAFLTSAQRSRREKLNIGGIYFLSKSAPKQIAWYFRSLLILISLIALVTALIKPYTELAFGLLTPVYVLGLMGMWGAKWGSFPQIKSEAKLKIG